MSAAKSSYVAVALCQSVSSRKVANDVSWDTIIDRLRAGNLVILEPPKPPLSDAQMIAMANAKSTASVEARRGIGTQESISAAENAAQIAIEEGSTTARSNFALSRKMR